MTADGKYAHMLLDSGPTITSNYGLTWGSTSGGVPGEAWMSAAISPNGRYYVLYANNGFRKYVNEIQSEGGLRINSLGNSTYRRSFTVEGQSVLDGDSTVTTNFTTGSGSGNLVTIVSRYIKLFSP